MYNVKLPEVAKLFKPHIVVTGFDKFEDVYDDPYNASWEAISLMNKSNIENKHDVAFDIIEIQVSYYRVDLNNLQTWSVHMPKLILHVEVSDETKCLKLIKQAYKSGYQRLDKENKCPLDNTCLMTDGPDILETNLDVERICLEFNKNAFRQNLKLFAQSSENGGRFLGEYLYYYSLYQTNIRSLLVRIPKNSIYPVADTARGLEKILDLCMLQVTEYEEKMRRAKHNVS